MGPPSENGGYGRTPAPGSRSRWSFNGATVRKRSVWTPEWFFEERAPFRSTRLPYFKGFPVQEGCFWGGGVPEDQRAWGLQWVHRPRTVVMVCGARTNYRPQPCFNGSTVRERWLWRALW